MARNIIETNQQTVAPIFARFNELNASIAKAYSIARRQGVGKDRVVLESFANAVMDMRGHDQITVGVLKVAIGELQNKGLVRGGRTTMADGITSTVSRRVELQKRGRRLKADDLRKATVIEAEQIRKNINQLWDSTSPAGRRVIRKLTAAIDEDVAREAGEDVFFEARRKKEAFEKLLERQAESPFDVGGGKSFLEQVLFGDVPEEKVFPTLMSSSVTDKQFRMFRDFLLDEAGPEGVQAWLNIKGQVLREALDDALSTQVRREGGTIAFNHSKFANRFAALRRSKKFDMIFNEDEKQLIADIAAIGELRLPIDSVRQGSGPTGRAVQQELASLRQQALSRIPFIGPGARAITEISLATVRSGDVRRALDPTRETAKLLRRLE